MSEHSFSSFEADAQAKLTELDVFWPKLCLLPKWSILTAQFIDKKKILPTEGWKK